MQDIYHDTYPLSDSNPIISQFYGHKKNLEGFFSFELNRMDKFLRGKRLIGKGLSKEDIQRTSRSFIPYFDIIDRDESFENMIFDHNYITRAFLSKDLNDAQQRYCVNFIPVIKRYLKDNSEDWDHVNSKSFKLDNYDSIIKNTFFSKRNALESRAKALKLFSCLGDVNFKNLECELFPNSNAPKDLLLNLVWEFVSEELDRIYE